MADLQVPDRRLHDGDRRQWAETRSLVNIELRPVLRADGSTVGLATLDSLLDAVTMNIENGEWPNRSHSDSWIAPRLHYALRISRAHASEKSMWEWLGSTRWQEYVYWRWADTTGTVASDRWFGGINKQALARLWWGAELLRDGPDYKPVATAFKFQDFPNSLLHRPVLRCRSFALGIMEALFDGGVQRSSRDVNALARILNLTTAGRPPEAATNFASDDRDAVAAWISNDAAPGDWDSETLEGPRAMDTSTSSRAGGRELAEHGLTLAALPQQTAQEG